MLTLSLAALGEMLILVRFLVGEGGWEGWEWGWDIYVPPVFPQRLLFAHSASPLASGPQLLVILIQFPYDASCLGLRFRLKGLIAGAQLVLNLITSLLCCFCRRSFLGSDDGYCR